MTETPWVDGLTIGEVLAETSRRFPDSDALVFPALGLRLSYSELDRVVDEAARGILSLGLSRGDHVAVWATNVPEWVILQLATARIGVVLVTINPANRIYELEHALAGCDARALFLIDRFKSSDYFSILREACPELVRDPPGALQSQAFPKLDWVVTLKGATPPGCVSWKAMIERGKSLEGSRLRAETRRQAPQEPINVQYTSGTTGFPKAAMLTHRNLLMNAFYIGECQRIESTDRICIPVPFYHCFGCVLGLLCAVVRGAAMIIPAEYFDPQATLDALERERATAIYGVPTMFVAMLEHESFPTRQLSSLRTGIMAGSPCPIEVMKRVVDQMGAHELTIAYGLTEASPVITQTRVEDPLEVRVETVGRTIPGVEVRIEDQETGSALDDNQQGELCVRGHGVMLGYYKEPEATAQAIDEQGWLHTGDLALRRPDGNFRITGRIKDVVIRGGENIYPREIEECLFTHPSIEQPAVFGVPDSRFGEEVCAWLKLNRGCFLEEDDVRDFCREKLAHYKVPRYIRFVDGFPQTVSGKIQKFRMREEMISELGLEEEETA